MWNCYTAIVTFMHYKDFDVIVSHSIFSVFVEKHQILHPIRIKFCTMVQWMHKVGPGRKRRTSLWAEKFWAYCIMCFVLNAYLHSQWGFHPEKKYLWRVKCANIRAAGDSAVTLVSVPGLIRDPASHWPPGLTWPPSSPLIGRDKGKSSCK